MKLWQSQNKKHFKYDDTNISVNEFEERLEGNNKHHDTKAVFLSDNLNHRIVVHSYNSTQNLKVEGNGYLDFLDS